MRTKLGWMVPFLLICTLGCGNYTVTFRIQEVINTGDRGDSYAKLLDIDIICLTPSDAKDNPSLARGAIGARAWFLSRENKGGEKITLDADRIYALRGLKSDVAGTVSVYDNYTADKRIDAPLRSVRDGGEAELNYKVHHPRFNSNDAVLLIYGRFHDGKGGLVDNAPMRLSPPPKWKTHVIVDVGRKRLSEVKQD
ncbi:MAG: hypothetical protein IID33_15800 [Planctomycetes bacterium]|nr:hypothetical protein [Planctomycetota bacterium]